MSAVAPPAGADPPSAVTAAGGERIELRPLAEEVCRRYAAEFPDESDRYGEAGAAWCLHDNLYLLAWAVEDVRLGDQLAPNLGWLARVLAARGFPLERLARDLELAAEVVTERVPGHAEDVAPRLRAGAAFVRSVVDGGRVDAVSPAGRLAEAYVAALLAGRPAVARRLVEQGIDDGLPVRDAYLQVLQPALERVGELWAAGRASVAQEHLATATTQVLAARLAQRLERSERRGGTVVVAATEGEQHALGPRFVADFLEAAGWNVLELGASTPVLDLVTLVARERPAAVALSTSLTTNLRTAEETFSRLRALPSPPVLAAGGRAYRGDAAFALRIGADVFARDAAELVELLEAARA